VISAGAIKVVGGINSNTGDGSKEVALLVGPSGVHILSMASFQGKADQQHCCHCLMCL
jgi:hypothetical protein